MIVLCPQAAFYDRSGLLAVEKVSTQSATNSGWVAHFCCDKIFVNCRRRATRGGGEGTTTTRLHGRPCSIKSDPFALSSSKTVFKSGRLAYRATSEVTDTNSHCHGPLCIHVCKTHATAVAVQGITGRCIPRRPRLLCSIALGRTCWTPPSSSRERFIASLACAYCYNCCCSISFYNGFRVLERRVYAIVVHISPFGLRPPLDLEKCKRSLEITSTKIK